VGDGNAYAAGSALASNLPAILAGGLVIWGALRITGNLSELGLDANDISNAADAAGDAVDEFRDISDPQRVDTGAGSQADFAATANEWLNPAVPYGTTEPALDAGGNALEGAADAGFGLGAGVFGTDEDAARDRAEEQLNNVPFGSYLQGVV